MLERLLRLELSTGPGCRVVHLQSLIHADDHLREPMRFKVAWYLLALNIQFQCYSEYVSVLIQIHGLLEAHIILIVIITP